MAKVCVCERDGFVMRGANDDELVERVQGHIADAHPDLVDKLSRADLLAKIRGRAARRGADPRLAAPDGQAVAARIDRKAGSR